MIDLMRSSCGVDIDQAVDIKWNANITAITKILTTCGEYSEWVLEMADQDETILANFYPRTKAVSKEVSLAFVMIPSSAPHTTTPTQMI